MDLSDLGARAVAAARALAAAPSAQKDEALEAMAEALLACTGRIVEANAKDLAAAEADGISGALLDRLRLTEARVASMAAAVRKVAAQPDPVGRVLDGWRLPNGVQVEKIAVPLGVLAIIYEARPNVTVDAAALAVKSGNAVLLRGYSTALTSNTLLAEILREATGSAGLPPDAVQLVGDTSRDAALALMRLDGYVDVLIPRGGPSLLQSIHENATVPVIVDGAGVCHVYVDAAADLDRATPIVLNAKVQRPSVCNAAESLLVHRDVADVWLPRVAVALTEAGVELRGDTAACALVPSMQPATEADFATEFLDLIMSVKVVASLDEAIAHVNATGTGHTEAILTEDYAAAERFVAQVDAAVVAVNASTRFTDGEEFGFGAEIGISTQKLHARGPMALAELCTHKYILRGAGQIRA